MSNSDIFEYIIDNALEIFFCHDNQGKVMMMNDVGKEELGYYRELTDLYVSDILPETYVDLESGLSEKLEYDGKDREMMVYRNNMTCFNYGVNGGKLAGTGGVVERYTSMETNLDYVIVFAGHNDSSSSIEIGTETDTGITTFYGALNTLCKGLQTKYPKARILFMTPSKRTGKEKPYADAMIIACRNYSIQCYDTYGKLGILLGTTPVSSGNANQKSIFELGNSIHLNEKGNEYLSYKIESELLTL